MFRFGGRLALDITWTFAPRREGGGDLLTTPDALAAWLVAAGLLQRRPPATDPDLHDAVDLRAAIYLAARARIREERMPRSAVGTVNGWARRPSLAPQLAQGGAGIRTAVPKGADPVAAALATVARDAVDLLGAQWDGRLRRCEREGCRLLFLDTSRPGHRRWCSAAGCGNAVNTARYRARRREGTGPG